jgi:hypothetical protein
MVAHTLLLKGGADDRFKVRIGHMNSIFAPQNKGFGHSHSAKKEKGQL